MPSLETPPNSAPPNPPVKVRTGRYGELEEHELIHLLDSLDDERSKARFRESIYISIIIYLAIVWFLFYGPRVLFHQPRLISPVDVLKEREKQLTFLDTPKDLAKLTPKSPKAFPKRATFSSSIRRRYSGCRRCADRNPQRLSRPGRPRSGDSDSTGATAPAARASANPAGPHRSA